MKINSAFLALAFLLLGCGSERSDSTPLVQPERSSEDAAKQLKQESLKRVINGELALVAVSEAILYDEDSCTTVKRAARRPTINLQSLQNYIQRSYDKNYKLPDPESELSGGVPDRYGAFYQRLNPYSNKVSMFMVQAGGLADLEIIKQECIHKLENFAADELQYRITVAPLNVSVVAKNLLSENSGNTRLSSQGCVYTVTWGCYLPKNLAQQ